MYIVIDYYHPGVRGVLPPSRVLPGLDSRIAFLAISSITFTFGEKYGDRFRLVFCGIFCKKIFFCKENNFSKKKKSKIPASLFRVYWLRIRPGLSARKRSA